MVGIVHNGGARGDDTPAPVSGFILINRNPVYIAVPLLGPSMLGPNPFLARLRLCRRPTALLHGPRGHPTLTDGEGARLGERRLGRHDARKPPPKKRPLVSHPLVGQGGKNGVPQVRGSVLHSINKPRPAALVTKARHCGGHAAKPLHARPPSRTRTPKAPHTFSLAKGMAGGR